MTRRVPHSPGYVGDKVVSAVDWRGNRFHVGDEVMYCIGAGRGQMMAIGIVVKIKIEQAFHRKSVPAEADEPDAFTRSWFEPGQHFKWIEIPYDDITVQVRTLKTSGRWDNEERSKPAWVNPMNITSLRTVETA